jgi:hypothetical protein
MRCRTRLGGRLGDPRRRVALAFAASEGGSGGHAPEAENGWWQAESVQDSVASVLSARMGRKEGNDE